jgi:hypothetical protein
VIEPRFYALPISHRRLRVRHEVMQLADGWAGTDTTVAKATQLVMDSLVDPIVRTTAEDIVRNLPERDKGAEIRAVSRFVRDNIRYTNEGVETIKTPRFLLDEVREKGRAVGDCDDHVILWLALHKVLGQKVRIKVVSQRPDGRATHIFGQVYNPQTKVWITDDTIKKDRKIGWGVPMNKRTAEKTYGDDDQMRGFEMPGYQMFEQSGTWAPGGAGRFYVNPNQRPGIRVGQLSVGRSLIPSHVQVRGADSLGGEGVGQFEFLSSLGPIIEAGGKAAAAVVAQKQAAKAASKAAKQARADANAASKASSAEFQSQVEYRSPGSEDFLKKNWQMLALGGGVLAIGLYLMRR